MNREGKNSYSRNRSLLVSDFIPRSWGEQKALDIAKAVGEIKVAYLKSVLDRHGLQVIESAFGELQDMLRENIPIRSKPRFLNYLINQRLAKGGEMSNGKK